jgi:hypothetical protein
MNRLIYLNKTNKNNLIANFKFPGSNSGDYLMIASTSGEWVYDDFDAIKYSLILSAYNVDYYLEVY